MSETNKPATTWQTYNTEKGILTVYNGDNEESGIHFQGKPEDYDGTATEPASPTAEYLEKQAQVPEQAESTEIVEEVTE